MTVKEYLDAKSIYINYKYSNDENKSATRLMDLLKPVADYNKELIKKYPWLIPTNRWSGKKITDCAGPNGEEGFWPGEPQSHPEYNYEYTELDDMPDGWRLAFGEQMCEEVQQELEKFDFVNKYFIEQIKEKYGGLRWYSGPCPVGKFGDPVEEYIGTWDERPEFSVMPKNGYLWRETLLDPYPEGITYEEIIADKTSHRYLYQKVPLVEKCHIRDIERKYEELSHKICIKCGKPAKWISTGWICPWCDDCKENIKDNFVTVEEYFKDEENETK